MRITITGKNIEVSDYLNDLVIKKVSKLDKYFPEDTEAHVTLAVERNRHIVEVTIPYTGGIIRGEETSGDMYASIDNVLQVGKADYAAPHQAGKEPAGGRVQSAGTRVCRFVQRG